MGLDILRVEQPSPDSAAIRHSDHHGHLHRAVGAVACPGCFSDQLVDRGPDEIGELDFRDRTHATECRAQGDAHDRGFRQRRVDDAFVAEFFRQALGGQEHSATNANVFAHDKYLGIAGHLFGDSFPDSFDYALNGQNTSFPLKVMCLRTVDRVM